MTALAQGTLAAAYDHCETVTRRASSNFYWGFRILPHERRRALCAVYAFCRAADDIADEPGQTREPARLLARWRGELDAVYAGRPTHPIGIALADAAEHYAIARSASRR
jgi:phytoene synthase